MLADNVYYQPPSGHKMQYPCIVYQLDDEDTTHADNVPYRRTSGYQVTVIHRQPRSDIREKVADLPTCRFDRRFTNDNLYHDVFHIFF